MGEADFKKTERAAIRNEVLSRGTKFMSVVGSFIRSHDVSPRGRSRKRGVRGWKRGLSAADQLSSVQRRRGLLNLGNGRGISCSWGGGGEKERREKRRYSRRIYRREIPFCDPRLWSCRAAGPRVCRDYFYTSSARKMELCISVARLWSYREEWDLDFNRRIISISPRPTLFLSLSLHV